MSSDVKIPEWAEKVAQDFHDKWDTGMSGAAFRDLVRALLSAEQRGRKAGIEEAAEVAGADDGNAPGGFGNPDFGPNVARRITAAIRSLGEQE